MVAKEAVINWLLPREGNSPLITIVGRTLAIGGSLALLVPIVLPLSAMGVYSELEMRLSLFITGTLLLATGIAIEKRHPWGFYLYLAGALMSTLAHLAGCDAYNFGLLLTDLGFLGIVVVRKREFFAYS